MALVLMAKAFKLNYSTPTNNNQRISSNPRNRQIAQPGMNMGQDRQMQMVGVQNVGNQVVQEQFESVCSEYGNQNAENCCSGVNNLQRNWSSCKECTVSDPRRRDAAYLQTHLLIAQKEEACVQLQAEVFDLIAAAADLVEIEETRSAEGGTVEQHPATVEETRAYFESLYNNLAIKVEKVNTVNRKLRETNADLTTELARYKNQEKCFEISQEKYDKLERCYQKSIYQEKCLTKKINALHLSFGKQITTLNEEIANLNNHLSKEKSIVSSLQEEKKRLKSDFKIREDELLDKQIQLENKIKELDNILRLNKFDHCPTNTNVITRRKLLISDIKWFRMSTGVDITTKTRRPQPRSNTKNDRVPSASKSSRIKNKEVEVEDHPRNLLLSKNKKHMSSECNNIKLAIRNDKSEIVCAMCKQCLITANHDACVLNYVNGMNSRSKKQKANVSNIANQTKHKARIWKPKNVGSKERLASPKPSKPRMRLRWSPTGKMINIKGKLIASSESNGDNACTPNPQEPTIKRFPNSTFSLGRLSNFWEVRFGNDHVAAIMGFNGDMRMYALAVSTMEPKNVNEAMTDPAWIESMQEELLQFKRLDVWLLVPPLDNIKPLMLKWLSKNKLDEENTDPSNKDSCWSCVGTAKRKNSFSKNPSFRLLRMEACQDIFVHMLHTNR
ncbi:hypothetical protein Tco_0221056 [Tanacetum coccineum]